MYTPMYIYTYVNIYVLIHTDSYLDPKSIHNNVEKAGGKLKLEVRIDQCLESGMPKNVHTKFCGI